MLGVRDSAWQQGFGRLPEKGCVGWSAAQPLSLTRRLVVRQVSGTRLEAAVPWEGGGTFGEALLAPTAIYVRRLLALIGAQGVDVRVRAARLHTIP